MNSLEWINAEITKWQEILESFKEQLKQVKGTRNEQVTLNHIECYELKLKYLQQIKSELEAWEVCKTDNSILYVLQTLAKGESIDWHRLPEEKQIKLKKALEVNEDAISK